MYEYIYIRLYIYIHIYYIIYIYIYIRRPLQNVERVRLHFRAYNIQPFPSRTPRSKAQKRTSVQAAKVARHLKSRNPTLQAPSQLESRIWNPDA